MSNSIKSFTVALPRIVRIERNRLTLNGGQILIGRDYEATVDEALFNRRPEVQTSLVNEHRTY